MNEQGRWNLMAKYLFGECTEEEAARLQAWLEAEPARKQQFEELQAALRATKESPHRKRDVEAQWGRMKQYVERSEQEKERPAGRPARHAQRRTRSRRGLRTAALAVLAACAVLLTLWVGEVEPWGRADDDTKTFATERGERATVRLADGTLVRLNAASSITLSPAFGEEQRAVRLEGEGYFEVARDADRPFIVQAGSATTRVLGTTFNIDAYPDGDHVEVVVAEGKVAFVDNNAEASQPAAPPSAGDAPADGLKDESAEAKSPSGGLVLTARQMATLHTSSGRIVRGRADLAGHLAWVEGELYFEDAPFSEVARKLERWYDLEVELADTPPPEGQLNARFSEEQPRSEVLSIVAAAFGLRYEQEGQAVRFYAAHSE